MQKKYIMTAFGKDRPGIVADVTQVLYENGCNLEDTSMSLLSDEFTINLLFSSGNERIESILAAECAVATVGSGTARRAAAGLGAGRAEGRRPGSRSQAGAAFP